ncbi:MAG TPA: TonB-dependent receptor [Stellaceae bacterium]|nr:TonB-dependent receptor [Stellaceae bacterium]
MAAEPATDQGLEEITVTARKRTENIQDVPAVVNAITAEQIQKFDLTSIEKVAAEMPDFSVGRASNGSGAQLTLRGIGTSSTSIGVEQSVATIVDGVYYGQGRVIDEGFFDLASIELLEGPQALFFGKNATAGVISFTTADPTDKPEYMARLGYEFGSEQVLGEAVASGPITDTLSLRLAVRGTDMFGGYYTNEATTQPYDVLDIATGRTVHTVAPPAATDEPGEDQFLGRVTAVWKPDSQLTATLKLAGDQQNFNNSSWNYVMYNCVGGFSHLNPTIPCAANFVVHQNDAPAQVAADMPFSDGGAPYNNYVSASGTGTIKYVMDEATLTSITNYSWNRDRWLCACNFQSSPTGTWATENSSWRALSEEARVLTTFDGPLNAMAGVYYQSTKRVFHQYIAFANLEDSAFPSEAFLATTKASATNGETVSPFAQITYKVIPSVELAAGARYTYETKDSFFDQPYNNPALTGIFTPATSTDPAHPGIITANQGFTNWSPEATVTWKPTDDVTTYAAYKTGYKSGGFSNSGINSGFSPHPAQDFVFRPEVPRGFELGIKTSLLDNRARLNLDLYKYHYQNLQVDFFNSPTFAFITTNAGSATTQGVDLTGEYAPPGVPGLTLHAALNYNDAKYGHVNFPCFAGETPAQGCNGLTSRQDLVGQPLAMAPKWSAAFGFNYETEVMGGYNLGTSFEGKYSDSYLASAFGAPNSEQGSYVTIDAAVRLTTADDQWEIALIGKNLTDQFFVTGVVDGPSTGSGTGTPAGVPADQLGFGNVPRTVMLQVTWRD